MSNTTSENKVVSNIDELVAALLSQLTPTYFLEENKDIAKSSTKKPFQLLNAEDKSRILDCIEEPKLSDEFAAEISKSIIKHGLKHGLARFVNPIIRSIIDVENQCLLPPIQEKIGREVFNKLIGTKSEAELTKQLIKACCVYFINTLNEYKNDTHIPLIATYVGFYSIDIDTTASQGSLFCNDKYHINDKMIMEIKALLTYGKKFESSSEDGVIANLQEDKEAVNYFRFSEFMKLFLEAKAKKNNDPHENSYIAKCHELLESYRDYKALFENAWKRIDINFFDETQIDGIQTPYECLKTAEYSRVFECLAERVVLPQEVIKAYVALVQSKGFEHANAKYMNDFIEQIVDFDHSKLQQKFIDKIGGDTVYQNMLDRFNQHISGHQSDAEKTIANSFKRAVPTLFYGALTLQKKNLNSKLQEDLENILRERSLYDEGCASEFELQELTLRPNNLDRIINMDTISEMELDTFFEEHSSKNDTHPLPGPEFCTKLRKVYTMIFMKHDASKKLLNKNLTNEDKVHYYNLLLSANTLLAKNGYNLAAEDEEALRYIKNQEKRKILALVGLTLVLLGLVVALAVTHGVTAPIILPFIKMQIDAILVTVGALTFASSIVTFNAYKDYKQKYHHHPESTETEESSLESMALP